MLVLGRREGDRVLIISPNGETVTVTVCRKKHGHLRLGFDAPKDHKIIRAESLEKNLSKQQSAQAANL